MPENGPRILVVDDELDERVAIASMLREAGFDVAAMAQDGAFPDAASVGQIAAAVIALPGGEGIDLLRRARLRRPELRGLLIVEPVALCLAEEDCGTLVKRPFDPRELLGCVFALVLREGADAAALGHGPAEFGIAAAKLACLRNRRAAATAVGAERLAHELTRQIVHLSLIR